MRSFNLNYLLKTLSPDIITLGLGFLHMNGGGGGSGGVVVGVDTINSIAGVSKKYQPGC